MIMWALEQSHLNVISVRQESSYIFILKDTYSFFTQGLIIKLFLISLVLCEYIFSKNYAVSFIYLHLKEA